jgi:hypothetical protein
MSVIINVNRTEIKVGDTIKVLKMYNTRATTHKVIEVKHFQFGESSYTSVTFSIKKWEAYGYCKNVNITDSDMIELLYSDQITA